MRPDPLGSATADLDHCAHRARNALAAIASAGELLSRSEAPHALAREAGVVVQRQVQQLSDEVGELIAHAQRADQAPGVLAVSDDAQLLATLDGLLGAEGCRVELAATSEDGLRALMSQRYDVAVIDVRTSRGLGLGLARRAREAGFDGRLVGIWGAQLPGRRQQDEGVVGFDRLLTRTFHPTTLRAVLTA